jgi:hypothetical protein
MATYQASLGDTLVPGSASVTELLTTVGGSIASCAWAGYAVVQHIIQGTPATGAEDTALTEQAVTEHQTVGRFADSGQATPQNIEYIAGLHGIHFLDLTQAQAVSVAGETPVEIGVSNAKAFGGSDSNVSGHYITMVGKTARGDLIVSDPNQPESEQGKFNVYSQAQLTAAQPFAFLAPSADSGSGPQTSATVAPGGIGTPGGGINIPGVGTIWSGLQGAASSLNSLGNINSTIEGVVGGFFSAAMVALKRIGVFALGLAAVVLGVIVIFRAAAGRAVGNAAKVAAVTP